MKGKRRNKNYGFTHFTKFEDLFKDISDIPYCLKALQEVVPAVVNESNEYLIKSKKGPVVAWKNILLHKGYIYWVNPQTLASLFNVQFKNLNIKDVSFRSNQSKVYVEYQMQFKQNLDTKLSS